MTALAKDRQTYRKDGKYIEYGVIASDIVYKGSLVSMMFGHATENGYAQPATNEWMNVFIGVANDRADNASGAADAVKVDVYKEGVFEFEYDGTPSAGLIGEVACIVDDQTVGLSSSTNCKYQNPCGIIVGILGTASTSNVRVRIDQHVDLFPVTETFLMLNDAVISRGGIVAGDAASPVEATSGADTANFSFLGIAIETVDNAADGSSIRCIQKDIRPVMLDGTQAIATYTFGIPMYMDGARAVDTAAGTANVDAFIGRRVAVGGTNDVYIALHGTGTLSLS